MAKKRTQRTVSKTTKAPAKQPVKGRPPRSGAVSNVRVPLVMTPEENERLERLARIVAPSPGNKQYPYNRSETIRIALNHLAQKHGIQ